MKDNSTVVELLSTKVDTRATQEAMRIYRFDMSSNRWSWLRLPLLTCIVICIVCVSYQVLLFYVERHVQTGGHPAHVQIREPVTNRLRQITDHTVNRGCNVTGPKYTFESQSYEDLALFGHYFSKPFICNGTFVEIGALDGILFSNTKFFEETLGWTGVLIEAQPANAAKLYKNRPRAKIFAEAVCPRGQNTVDFIDGEATAVGGVAGEMTKRHKDKWISSNAKTYSVPCRPIGDMLKASGVTAVDFFILDVEGAELMVLETMDWSIPVKVFVVEMGRGAARDQEVRDLLSQHGYYKTKWDIQTYCADSCTNNEVFENPNYEYVHASDTTTNET